MSNLVITLRQLPNMDLHKKAEVWKRRMEEISQKVWNRGCECDKNRGV